MIVLMGSGHQEDAMKKEMATNRCAIYARVSTDHQDEAMQLRELRTYVKLRGWRLDGEYIDRMSGAKRSRPATGPACVPFVIRLCFILSLRRSCG